MKSRALVSASLLGLLLGCGSGPAAPDVAVPADGLLISVTAPGPCLIGGCDRVNLDATTLALVTLSNTSGTTVFLAMCGTAPAIAAQQLIDGKWQFIGGAIACPFGPSSKPLAPNDSIQLNAFYGSGTFRLDLAVAADEQLSTEAESISAPFTVR